MDVNCIMVCFCIFAFPNNHGIMAYIEFNCNKNVKVIYSEAYLTIIKGKKIIDRFGTGSLSVDEVLAIGCVIKNIVDKWYLHGILLERRLEEVRYLPIY